MPTIQYQVWRTAPQKRMYPQKELPTATISINALMGSLRCSIGLLVTPAFLCLTGVALLSTLIPFLQELALHGKTRPDTKPPENGPDANQNNSSRSSTETSCAADYYRHFFLRGDVLLINKRYFLHFYVAGSLSLAAFLLGTPTDPEFIPWDLVLLVAIHLLRRCYECRMVHRYSQNSKMHIAGYICGVFHYLFLPFMMLGVVCNGAGANELVDNTNDLESPGLYHMHYRLCCGILCIWGQLEQCYHHYLLASLRKTTGKEESNQTTRHKIPSGRWFQYVSCPHYLAEIIIYVAFAALMMIQQGSSETGDMSSCGGGTVETSSLDAFPAIFQHRNLLDVLLTLRRSRHYVLLLWVAGNLTVTATRSHRWYLESFPTYHALNRKAIFPLIF